MLTIPCFFLLFSWLFATLQATRDTPGRTALDNYPLIDGSGTSRKKENDAPLFFNFYHFSHNDLPYNLYHKLHNQISNFSFDKDLSRDPKFGFEVCHSCNTDLIRIKKGKLGAQFWSAFVDCEPYNTVVSRSLEQVDVIKRLVEKYPRDMELVKTADGIEDAFLHKRLASLIGLEGGHSIDNKLALLRQFYELGVRYMTITQNCDLAWADSCVVDSDSKSPIINLTDFGKKVILEMNRLGMMVDLSHVSHNVMSEVIDTSKAPVIFSHSSAYSVFPHHRNVKDDVLLKLQLNGGIVMVNFYSEFLGKGHVTIRNVTRHINHIVDVAGIDHVGIGSDFDGVNKFPEGLEDVSKYPDLFDLLRQLDPERWTIENLEKLAGRNLYRVFKKVEEVRDRLVHEKPDESLIPASGVATAEKLQAGDGSGTLSYSTVLSFCTVALLFILQ